ncbi:hypothetical protein [Pseudorhodoferax sp. Leaf274]|uniref:hypothetical protein n=1 Tax=Pseudorhodoferax sp. Leaf274 TaxID=1736318 RepID=UPI00138F3171|nr:hypothetical protein [Pseudorhodoferax sp. Leaf274]
MHRHPAALTHLQHIRECLAHVADEQARKDGLELVERIEIYIRFQKLTKSMMLEALDALRGIPGTEASIEALEAMASSPARK